MNYYGNMRITKIQAWNQSGEIIEDTNFILETDTISFSRTTWDSTTKYEDFTNDINSSYALDSKTMLKWEYNNKSFYMDIKGKVMLEDQVEERDKILFKRIRSNYGAK